MKLSTKTRRGNRARRQSEKTQKIEAAAADRQSQQQLHLTAHVDFNAAAKDEQGQARRPTFKIDAYNGGAMHVGGWHGPVVVDLAGLSAPSDVVPVLRDHNPEKVVGQATVKISSKQVRLIDGVVTSDAEWAQDVVTNARNGFRWQASIGAVGHRRELVDAGKSVVVNGRKINGPVTVVREATLREVSFLSMGADGTTTSSIEAQPKSEADMNFEAWLKAQGFDPETLSEQQTKSLRAAYDREHGAQGTPPASTPAPSQTTPSPAPAQPVAAALPSREEFLKAMRDEAAKEHLRVATISQISARYGVSEIEVDGKKVNLVAHAIEAGWGQDKVELEAMRAGRPKAPAGHIVHRTASAEVLEAALCQAGRLDGHEERYSDETLQAAHTAFRGRIGLQELFLHAALAGGYEGRTLRAFHNDLAGVLRAAFSTASLSGILSNTANKFLLEGFMHVDQAWREISSRANVSDFKTTTSYRMTGAFEFDEVGPSGELKHDTIDEESFTNRAKTYGRMFAITREMLINDDLGALTAIPRRIGRGAALKLNDVFWTAFLDNASFFTSGRNNYFEGASTNLQSSSLKTAVEKFLKQTDPDGKPIAVMPKILLVPPEEMVTADELYTSLNVNTGGASTKDKVPSRNIWAAKYKPVTSPYLSNSAYSGYSTTGWYLLADPMDVSVIEVAFLNGVESPTVESAEADFNVLGVQMRGYFDFGVAKQDWRGGVKSKGAA